MTTETGPLYGVPLIDKLACGDAGWIQGMTMTPATDAQVRSYILQLLDDYKPHDWDETLIAVSVGCEAVGLSLYARQEETCLYELIRLGEVKERWRGDMATLQRIRVPIPIERLQKTLWE